MYKTILMMLLVAVSSSAMAEWVKVAEDEDGAYYIDPNTIRRLGSKVNMWILHDLNSVEESTLALSFYHKRPSSV
jgi:hypothetical protein